MQIVKLHPTVEARARLNVQRARYRAWRRQVENFQTATGSRPTLIHVPDDIWRAHFTHDTDACSAVIEQLQATDD